MATVESMNLARLLALEADTVIGGHIDGSGDLILEQHDGSTINAGSSLPTVPDASETVKGKVELATTTEATTGTDTTRAVTPAGLAAAVGSLVPDASTTVKGKVELATTTEASTGTDTDRAVTPAGLAAMLAAHVYPVGSIYLATVSTNPNTLLGFGTWSAIQGRFLIGVDGTYTAGSTGGNANKTLATGELPSHTHSFSASTDSQGDHTHDIARDNDGSTGTTEKTLHSTGITSGYDSRYNNQLWPAGAHTHSISGTTGGTGSGTAFSILPPYLAVYMWQRTA
jgi:microcystin-dependent protein